jgi:hypothetical protein
MRLIGLLLLLLAVLAVGYRQLTVTLAPGASVQGPGVPIVGQGAVSPPDRQTNAGVGIEAMTAAMALSWCISGACDANRFEQTREANGVINPTSVHFRTGPPTSFQIPAGVYAQHWDCFASTEVHGPTTTVQTCEATFRRE